LPGRTAAGRSPGLSTSPEAASALKPAQLTVSPDLFRKFQKLVYSETGIWLGNSKTALLCGRLYRRLVTLGIPSLERYYDCVSAHDGHEERARMIDAITTNETRFFREPRQFDFLVEQVFPRWQADADRGARSKRVRIWSAGCSSGEEPYSLAMLLAKHLPADKGWDTRLLATDISNRVLEKARKGIYDSERASDIPKDLQRRFMLQGFNDRQGQMKVQVAIQEMVEFRRLNLNQEPYPVEGAFDAILCRNVLIYFDAASKQKVVTNLVRHLAAGGFLLVGHAESLTSLCAQLRSVEPTIYTVNRAESGRGAGPSGRVSAEVDGPERRKAIGTSAGR
jgi:chemotaxis protein methyltransferase CheR